MARSQQKRKETQLEDGRTSRRLAAGGLGTPTKPGDDGHPDEDGDQSEPPSRSPKKKKKKKA